MRAEREILESAALLEAIKASFPQWDDDEEPLPPPPGGGGFFGGSSPRATPPHATSATSGRPNPLSSPTSGWRRKRVG